jgi:autotransporter-associated beta strand protein
VLRITHASALGGTGASGNTEVANGARLELSGGITVASESLIITGNGGNSQGALHSVSGINTWAGTVTIGGAGTRIGGAAGATLIISGNITDGTNTFGLAIRTADGMSNTVILSGSGSDYGGDTEIVVGTLRIAGGDNRLPIGTILRIGNSPDLSEARFDLNGLNQQVGGLASLGATMFKNVTSATAGTLTINNVVAASTYAGTITGAVAITKTGSFTQTFSGLNTYSGATNINGGTLAATVANSLSANSAVTLANVASASLNVTDLNQTIGSLAGGGATGGNVVLGSATLTTGRNNTNTAYAGVISGTNGKIVKEGSGSFALNGVNTYTGATTVKAGTLIVGGSVSGSVATVGDVASGVTEAVLMGGNGAVSGTAALAGISGVTSGARIDAGAVANTAGVLNTGTFSLTNSAHLSLHIGGTTAGGNNTTGYDRINVLGSASASLSGGTLDLFDITTGVGVFAEGSILFLVVNNGAGGVSTLPGMITLNGALVSDPASIFIGGMQFYLVNNANFDGLTGPSGGTMTGGNDLALIAVPEPASWMTMMLGTGLVVGLRRFRRRRG